MMNSTIGSNPIQAKHLPRMIRAKALVIRLILSFSTKKCSSSFYMNETSPMMEFCKNLLSLIPSIIQFIEYNGLQNYAFSKKELIISQYNKQIRMSMSALSLLKDLKCIVTARLSGPNILPTKCNNKQIVWLTISQISVLSLKLWIG